MGNLVFLLIMACQTTQEPSYYLVVNGFRYHTDEHFIWHYNRIKLYATSSTKVFVSDKDQAIRFRSYEEAKEHADYLTWIMQRRKWEGIRIDITRGLVEGATFHHHGKTDRSPPL